MKYLDGIFAMQNNVEKTIEHLAMYGTFGWNNGNLNCLAINLEVDPSTHLIYSIGII